MVSDAAHQHEDDEDNENKAQTTAWSIAPVAAVSPSRESSKEHEKKNDEKNGDHGSNGLV